MVRGHGLFMVLPVAAVSVVFGGHPWGGTLLLLVALSRVWALRVALVWWLTVGLCLSFGGYLVWQHNRQTTARYSVTQSTDVQTILRVAPDAYTVTGTGYRFLATTRQGEKLLVRGRLKTADELHRLQRLTVPTQWRVVGQQQGLLPAPNFAQFEGARYWERRGVVNTLQITAVTAISPASKTVWFWWPDLWHSWRSRLLRACERLPGALGVYAAGLLAGGRTATTGAELSGMQRLGLIHLFAISGLHVALVMGALTWLAVHLHLPREWWEWGLILSLPGYAILAGGGSGVLRASWMRGTQLIAQRFGWSIGALEAWSLALLVGVWCNPGLLFELGSQLSYGLSLALILLRSEPRHWRQVGLTLMSLPSLLVGVFQWHGLTLLANALVVPLFPVFLLPVTLIGTLVAPWWPAGAVTCAHLLGAVDTGIARLATLPGNLVFGQPPWWVAWGWLLLTWWLFTRPVGQRRRWLGILLASYLVVFGCIHRPFSGEVSVFDVGQGDSILIREPGNHHVSLIDVGGHLGVRPPAWAPPVAPRYAANQTVIPYLKSRGITRIDDLYLTHHDADHIGDLPAILASLRVTRLWVPAGMEREPQWSRRLANQPTVRIRPLQVGQAAPLRVWHPFQPGVADNGGSLALEGTFGGLRFLFMGDLDQRGERRMMAANPQLRTDVLKVGHHGSRTATAPTFVQQVRPRLALISAGRHNRYGHPNQETLTTLQHQHIPLLMTQTRGMIRYTYRGNHGVWETKLHLEEERHT